MRYWGRVILALVILGVGVAYSGVITPNLQDQLNSTPPNGKVRVLVVMKQTPDFNSLSGLSREDKVTTLKAFMKDSQKNLLGYLNSLPSREVATVRSFWIFNGLLLEATPTVIQKVAMRTDVAYVKQDEWIAIQYEKEEPEATLTTNVKSVEWNVQQINADDVWNLGYTGEGVIIGSIDTGVDVTHPALQGKWTGYWHDATWSGCSSPCDDMGHGTHTMGTILGGDGPGPFSNDIGVAPGAHFVTAKAFWYGFGMQSWLLDCMEWMGDLVGQGVNIRAVSNSWGSCDQTDQTFWSSVETWRNLGIIPVFAIGNSSNCGYSEPPPYGTAVTPGNFPTVIGVGATDNADNIASFSLRGPAPDQSPWNNPTYWGRPDWDLIKPDISAPGVNVRSSVPGGGYDVYSGTSMACPHITGVVALLLSKNPDLTYTDVYNIILDNAYEPPQGGPYPNNIYGWGRVDALAAINATPGPFTPGDANGDGYVDTNDLIYLANYLFAGGPAPDPYLAGDVNGDCTVNSTDLTYLANYLYAGGPAPIPCTD